MESANEILGFDILSIMFKGTDEDLKKTQVTQPSIFIHSVAALKAASEAKNALASVAREYLAHTGLLYRGRCFACTPHTL